LTEVRDTVLGMMPDLLRIFVGADGVCSYKAVPSEDPDTQSQREDIAKQATDFVQHVVLKQDNPEFFRSLHDTFQDGLVRKKGFIKAWWKKSKKPVFTTHTGLDEDMLLALAEDDEVTVVGKRRYVDSSTAAGPVFKYDVKLKRVVDRGHVCIEAVACENVFVSDSARGIGDAKVFGHSEDQTLSWFIEQGYAEEDLENCDRDPNDADSAEALARRDNQTKDDADDTAANDKSQKTIKYTEAYVIADRDGDGIAELIRVSARAPSTRSLTTSRGTKPDRGVRTRTRSARVLRRRASPT
jgi:hypothetical protein